MKPIETVDKCTTCSTCVAYCPVTKATRAFKGPKLTGPSSERGCTRTTGLCLNMLGIPYEHVNENQWSHQWCRVPMPDGSYWICDAYGLYCGPEPAPYQHPYL